MVQKVEERVQPNTDNNQTKLISCDITDRKHTSDLSCENFYVAADILSTAVSAKDVSLAKKCTDVLNQQLNHDNVLFVLSKIPRLPQLENYEPSAPPLVHHDDHQEDCLENLVDNLRNDCLLEIDKNADYVLKHKDMLQLGYRDLLSITTRDSLGVSSESIVYNAVVKWGLEEGKRRGIASPEQNLKKILVELVYAPRYGCMSKSEFISRKLDNGKCVDKGNILTDTEMRQYLNHIKKVSKHQQGVDLPFKGSQPRVRGADSRTLHSAGSNCSSTISKSACDKHIINFLTCWTAVFD